MGGKAAPKDPESRRSFFYVMRDKEIFGSVQPDGRNVQFIYEDMGRLENSAHVTGNVTDESMLALLRDTAGFRRLVHSIGVSVETEDPAQEIGFIFQMYGKEDRLGGGTQICAALRGDGAEVRLRLEEQEWSGDDKEPGQILFLFSQPELLAVANVRFYLNDGYQAPEMEEETEIAFTSEAYRDMIQRSLMSMGDTARTRRAIEKRGTGKR